VVRGKRILPDSLRAMTRLAKSATALGFSTPARLYVSDAVLERLPQDLENMAAELGQFIQEEHPLVGQRHVPRHRHGAPADQPHIGDGVMGRDTGGS
jgi:hypothetical protein